MVKEGVEDWRWFIRKREEVNSRKIKVHTANGVLVDRTWKELRVANVTMKLDGEANLKIKHCMECTTFIVHRFPKLNAEIPPSLFFPAPAMLVVTLMFVFFKNQIYYKQQ
ncbi:HAD-like domain-containing protein [Artemisia annua]|uniref:HAD-like domain-containing protein n=1 Tax=Artemisia annua TaxID=35608 RepID=A0A2U1KLI8_ARTAN|nr:HAD-like domain-containing protein [Artemisia annua]